MPEREQWFEVTAVLRLPASSPYDAAKAVWDRLQHPAVVAIAGPDDFAVKPCGNPFDSLPPLHNEGEMP